MFDTHTHLNFKAYKKTLHETLQAMKDAGVQCGVIPGTDVTTSTKAVQIAEENEGLWAAVGIHPHHTYELTEEDIHNELEHIDSLLQSSKVVAVGEVGIDCHTYEQTKYENYTISPSFITLQEELFRSQIRMAIKHSKSLIIHNREGKDITIRVLQEEWSNKLQFRSVFHCCEPDDEILAFALEHKMYIGVDGDITYKGSVKPDFLKKVPIEHLVLETDSPFLLPEPLRTERKYPNSPSNLPLIAQAVSLAYSMPVDTIAEMTTKNALRLFNLSA